MRGTCLAWAMLALSLSLGAQQAPAAKPMPYETYCQMERTEKRALFKSLPPEQRARLARTHMERWRDANKAKLSEPQLALLKEMIAAIGPAMFDGGTEAEQTQARELAEALESRADAVFTNTERRALRYDAPCAQ